MARHSFLPPRPTHKFGLGCNFEDAIPSLNKMLRRHQLKFRTQKSGKWPEQIKLTLDLIKPRPPTKAWLKGFDHGNHLQRRFEQRLPKQKCPYKEGTKEYKDYQRGYSRGADEWMS